MSSMKLQHCKKRNKTKHLEYRARGSKFSDLTPEVQFIKEKLIIEFNQN